MQPLPLGRRARIPFTIAFWNHMGSLISWLLFEALLELRFLLIITALALINGPGLAHLYSPALSHPAADGREKGGRNPCRGRISNSR